MPASASTLSRRPEALISRLSAENAEIKLKALRELKNQVIGNRTKKLTYIKLGAVPAVVEALSSASHGGDSDADASILVQSAAALGSFACGVDAGAKAVVDSGALPHFVRLLSHPNVKVVDTSARSLRMIYQSKLAPKYDFLSKKDQAFLLSLLDGENENLLGLGLSIMNCSCERSADQKALCNGGVLKKLINLIEVSPSHRDATLESLATILKDNAEVISEFVNYETGRALYSVSELTTNRSPQTRLYACMCLIVIRNASSYLQDIAAKTKLILILLELLDDPGHVGNEASFVMSSLIADKEDMLKLAFEASAVDKLVKHLQVGSLQTRRIQGILLALADLCSKLECCRSRLLSLQVMDLLINALTHDGAEVRASACICLRSVSRSIKNLTASCFSNDAIINPLVQLLHDPSSFVQVAALGAISNILVDITTQRSSFVRCGGVQQLAQLSKSMDSIIRLNAVWALKNLMFLADNRFKDVIFSELTASLLASLICDPEPSVQVQALALVRNLINGCADAVELVLSENGVILNAVGRQMQNFSKAEVGIQGMYALCNVAAGGEFHRDAVMHQILARSENGSQSVALKFLQSHDSRLRTAAIWVIVNLTIMNLPGASLRFAKLQDAGVVSQVKAMVEDPCLDVKLRARMVLGQSSKFSIHL